MCMIVYYKCILDGSVGLKFLTTCILVYNKYFFCRFALLAMPDMFQGC